MKSKCLTGFADLGLLQQAVHQAFSKEFAAHNRWLSILADTRMICKSEKNRVSRPSYKQQEIALSDNTVSR